MRCIILVFLVAFLTSQCKTTVAVERDSSVIVKVIKHGLTDSKHYLFSPAKWDKKDWLVAGGVGIATAALITKADQPIYNFANTLHTSTRDVISVYTEPMGDIYPFVSMAGFLVSGIITKNNYATETALIAAESYIITGAATQFVKTIAGRTRPNKYGNTNPLQWEGPFFKGNSFFSGHTSVAFSVASVYAYRYKETVWVPILSYGLATVGGLQRIYGNRHWASDVLMGAAIGTASGLFLCKQWEKNSIMFFPSVNTSGASVALILPIN